VWQSNFSGSGCANSSLSTPTRCRRVMSRAFTKSTPADVRRKKVDVVADELARISPAVSSIRIASIITVEAIAKQLAQLDLVFGCTDDNAGRLVLSRLATYMLIPVIDSGVILPSDGDGLLDGIHGRVTTLASGAACLVCGSPYYLRTDRFPLGRFADPVLQQSNSVRTIG
jgi:ThiF family protein